jgi:PAS domain S-box-containing protein
MNNRENSTGLIVGDTLDEIVAQNTTEVQRRQAFPQGYTSHPPDRRQSMMGFGMGNANMGGFHFDPHMNQNQMMRRQSAGEMDIAGFGDISNSMNMMGHSMGFQQSPTGANMLANQQFSGMPGKSTAQMMGFNPMGMDGLTDEESNALRMFSPTDFNFNNMAMQPTFAQGQNMNSGMASNQGNMAMPGVKVNTDMLSGLSVSGNVNNSPGPMNLAQGVNSYSSPASGIASHPSLSRESTASQARSTSQATPQDTEPVVQSEPKNYQGIYSQSGFDMLGALMKVASRSNPEIDIGKVDLSCAFVVCDLTQPDCPIVYVSDIFERLTGYTRFEVMGRNCRFLQSPDGSVVGGVRREFVDDDSVYYLKRRIETRKEAQRSLINYRKGGQPFMNLLTMIPITGEDDKEFKYIVGFQVDLVEKPTSVEGKNASGLYTVDYSQSTLPRYIWQPPDSSRAFDGGQTVSRDDVSTVLSSINTNADSELTKRLWDKVLLENTDDVVHVLSLKGLFLYLSPSCRNVLEYDPAELVGTGISSVCHPSDIVPVTRELKDTIPGAPVNVVYRIRRKKSGYTWFESHGSLCVEQGKGRKCIILVGRERPVYALHRDDLDAAGGIGEAEIWTKVSTSGMFLFVSSNVRTLLDRSPEDLIGTSIQALMRPESRELFNRALEQARTGKRSSHKHEVFNKRGLVLQAQTTLYPGDASEGQKPTFLVAQTRLLKTSRNGPSSTQGSKTSAANTRTPSESGALSTQPPTSPNVGSADEPVPTLTRSGAAALAIGNQDQALAAEDNIFDELKTTRCTSWQFELRQMEKSNRLLAEELAALISNKKKRKRRRPGHVQRDCANCHTRTTPEWRRGPSGQRDLCNSCGLRWAKQVSPVVL